MTGIRNLITLINRVRSILFILAIISLAVVLLCMVMKIKPAVVTSGSMEPAIPTGSVAFVDEKDRRNLQEGDIIAFRRQDELITHRIVSIDGDGIRTKGDNNNIADLGVVTESDVIGKTIFWIPKAGYCIRWICSKEGLIIFGTLCLILMLSACIDDKEGSS